MSVQSSDKPDIFIVAGEASGDMIGSLLVRQLRKQNPDIKVAAVGGDRMEEAGANVRFNIVRDLAIVGIVEIISKIGKIRRVFNDTIRYIEETRPKVVVFIDYPGFNLRLAKRVHELGIKVVYYVIPQVWAWHKSRIHKLRKYVDRALVIFPFEETELKEAGVRVEYVGHPLLDIMILTMQRAEIFELFKLDPARKLIGILPGSRRREIELLLPVMLEAAGMIQEKIPDVQFVLPRAATIKPEQIERHLAMSPVPVQVVDSYRYNVRSQMDFALVASGTATLETGLLLTPMVILYRVSYPEWFMGRLLVQLPYIGLINILAGEMIAPELLQDQCRAKKVAKRSLKIMNNPAEIERIKSKLEEVKQKMGGRGASLRAAQVVLEICEKVAHKHTEGEKNGASRVSERSNEEFGFKDRVLISIGRAILRAFFGFLHWSCRIEYHGVPIFREALLTGRPVILACWHSDISSLILMRQNVVIPKMVTMISRSRDGAMISAVAPALLDIVCVRGSSSRGGARGVLEFRREMLQNTDDGFYKVGLHFLDGPRGPRHQAKAGIAVLAQTSGALVVPIVMGQSRRIILRSWDRHRVPLPFSRIVACAGEPVDFCDENETPATKPDAIEESASERDMTWFNDKIEQLARTHALCWRDYQLC